jgi:hypothetical protein
MLERLMEEIRKGGTLETGVLSAKLGTSPQLIRAMLEDLQRRGLIRPYAGCEEGAVHNLGCQSCGLRDACGSNSAVRLWQSNPEG